MVRPRQHRWLPWDVEPAREITNGLGISVNVSFETPMGPQAGTGEVTFFSAGARFEDVPPDDQR
jgi:hypothetical protein